MRGSNSLEVVAYADISFGNYESIKISCSQHQVVEGFMIYRPERHEESKSK